MAYIQLNKDLEALKHLLHTYEDNQVFVLTAPHLHNILITKEGALLKCLDNYPVLLIDDSESSKVLDTVAVTWDLLLQHQATRHALLICLGGGVITDLGGFAASTYKRGIDFVHIPTTLLGMVDAAIGGKTGVNYGGIKNCVGTFAEPIQTYIYPPLLCTLPAEEFLSGYAELIKTCLLSSQQDFNDSLMALECLNDEQLLEYLISRCAAIKSNVVTMDHNEKGIRKCLNLGHTIGHAIEEYSMSHQPLRHGYAVMQGLVAAAYLSVTMVGLDREVLRQLSHIMVTHYGHASCACSDYDELIKLMKQDKKNVSCHTISFTLLRAVGQPVVDCVVQENMIRESLDYLFSL